MDKHQQTNRLLEVQQRQTSILLDMVQQLQEEMVWVRIDNERLMRD